jgi:hypothetical protein
MEEIQPGSFIFAEEKVLSAELCSDIIRRFEMDPRKHQGFVGLNYKNDASIKDSTDLCVSQQSGWGDIDKKLHEILAPRVYGFTERFRGLNSYKLGDTGYQIQHTKPGAIGYVEHADYMAGHSRQLSIIFYLNDVEEGETEFRYQQLKVKPESGKLLFFPPFWTHLHTGLPPKTDKYIITAWVSFETRNVRV